MSVSLVLGKATDTFAGKSKNIEGGKENVSSRNQVFIAVSRSFDVHVRIPQVFPTIPRMV